MSFAHFPSLSPFPVPIVTHFATVPAASVRETEEFDRDSENAFERDGLEDVDLDDEDTELGEDFADAVDGESPPLHRIREVRRLQGVSLRSVARQTGVNVRRLRAQEASDNLYLSDIRRWQKALDVPVAELLEAPTMDLSPVIRDRARLVRLMKTVAAMVETATEPEIRELAQGAVDELVEVMPELKEVAPWHTVGQRRGGTEMGRIAEQVFSLGTLDA